MRDTIKEALVQLAEETSANLDSSHGGDSLPPLKKKVGVGMLGHKRVLSLELNGLNRRRFISARYCLQEYSCLNKDSTDAFSVKSLQKGAESGYFDLEALNLLQYIRRHPDRQMLYDQEFPWSPEKAKEILRAIMTYKPGKSPVEMVKLNEMLKLC